MAVGIHILVILEQLFLKWWPVLRGCWAFGKQSQLEQMDYWGMGREVYHLILLLVLSVPSSP